MPDWRIKYKRDYLETIVNEKRVFAGHQPINSKALDRLIQRRMKQTNLTQLEVTQLLIKQFREGDLEL